MLQTSTAAAMSEVGALPHAPQGVVARCVTAVRFSLRMLAFVIGTLAFWAAMEIDFLVRRGTRRIDIINTWTPRWSGTLLRVFGIRVDAGGPYADQGRLYPGRDERGVGRIFVMNHRSGADIPIVLKLAGVHVISRHDLARWPLIGWGARRIGTLFVDRASRRSGATVLKQISETLLAGEGVAMFPEGTAFPGDEVREFKPGAFKAAIRAGSEIVPMGIAYNVPAAYYTDRSFMKHMKRIASLPRLCAAVEIGEPIRIDGKSAVDFRDQMSKQVERLVAKARQRLDSQPSRSA